MWHVIARRRRHQIARRQEHSETPCSNALQFGRENHQRRPCIGTTIRVHCKKDSYGSKNPLADTIQTPNLQALQVLHPSWSKLSGANKTAKRTAHRNHMPQLWETDAYALIKKGGNLTQQTNNCSIEKACQATALVRRKPKVNARENGGNAS